MIITIDIDEKELKKCFVKWWNEHEDTIISTKDIVLVQSGDVQEILGTEKCKVEITKGGG